MRVILFSLLLAAACKAPDGPSHTGQFLNMDSLINEQSKALIGYSVKKDIQVNDSTFATKEFRNVSNWSNELNAFQELNQINRPTYRDAYVLTDAQDLKSNLIIKTWTARTALPLRSFKLYILPTTSQIKRIEAEMVVSDFYYDSDRKLVLDFSLLGAGNRLEAYHISGTQKYFWASREHFSVSGVITP